MPESDDKNKGAGGGAGQGGAGGGAGAGDDTVTLKKSELDKINSDSENYKTGMLKYKKDSDDLAALKKKEADDKAAKDAAAAAGNNGGSAGETNVGEVAMKAGEKAASKVLRDTSEKTAKAAFIKAHPEYAGEAWTELLKHLTFSGSEVTHDEVMDRFESALFEHKRKSGKLDEYMDEQRERARSEGRAEGALGAGYGTGAAGDGTNKGKSGTLSPKGEEMARAMHVDPEKVKKVDPSKDNVINP